MVRAGNGGGDGPPGARLRSAGRAAGAVAAVERGTTGAGTVHQTARGTLTPRARGGRAQHGRDRNPARTRRWAQDTGGAGPRRWARGPRTGADAARARRARRGAVFDGKLGRRQPPRFSVTTIAACPSVGPNRLAASNGLNQRSSRTVGAAMSLR